MKTFLLSAGLLLLNLQAFAAATNTPKLLTAGGEQAKGAAPAKAAEVKAAPAQPELNLQNELAKIVQKAAMTFNQVELVQLSQAVELAVEKTLKSKDFDQGFAKLLLAVQDMAATAGSNLSVCKDLQAKLTTLVDALSADFNKLANSTALGANTNEHYYIKVANAVLAGLKKGLAKAKPSKEACAMPLDLEGTVVAPKAAAPVVNTEAVLVAPKAEEKPAAPANQASATLPVATPVAMPSDVKAPVTKTAM